MIRFRLQELLADKQFREGQRVTLTELSAATGINRVTLSKMVNHRGYSTVTANLDRLCAYFNCSVGEVAVFVPDEAPTGHKDSMAQG